MPHVSRAEPLERYQALPLPTTKDEHWRFTDLAGRGCKVEFRLHYEFAGRLLDRLISPVFDHIAGTLVEAFVKRAGQIYGSHSVISER